MSADTHEPTAAVFSVTGLERIHVTCPSAVSSKLETSGLKVPVTFEPGPFSAQLYFRAQAGQRLALAIGELAPLQQLFSALQLAGTAMEGHLRRSPRTARRVQAQRLSALPPAPAGDRSPASRSCSTAPEPGSPPAAAGGNSPRREAAGMIPGAANGTSP